MSENNEFTKFESGSSGTFCKIKPSKNTYIILRMLIVSADAAGVLLIEIKDTKGNWHTLTGVNFADKNSFSPLLPVISNPRGSGIPLKRLYDGEKEYTPAHDGTEMFRANIYSGTATWGVTVSWREEEWK